MDVQPVTETTETLAVAGIIVTTVVAGTSATNVPYTGAVSVAMVHAHDADLETATPADVAGILDLIHADLEERDV
jgi:hypothetical protein